MTSDLGINFNVYQCFYNNCIVPRDPNSLPPPNNRPDDALFWSERSTWIDGDDIGWLQTDETQNGNILPEDRHNIIVNKGT